jgi:HD-like signal output (HDOD) protein
MDSRKDKATSIALAFLQAGASLPSLSTAGAELLALSQQPLDDLDIEQFVKLVEIDPALTSKFLQLANSAYFGRVNKIIGLGRAIAHMGLDEAINTVYMLFCQKALPKFPSLEGFSDKDYWAHSWACAAANKMLGHPKIGVRILPGQLYIAGLLHGIGKLILAIHRPEDFLLCLRNSRDFGQPLSDAELDILGTTDAYIACEILKTWQLPENICMAVKYYQSPEDADEPFREFAGLTQFAYYLANTSGIGNINDEFCYDVKETWIVKEGSSSLAEASVREAFSREIHAALKKKFTTIAALGGSAEKGSVESLPAVQAQKQGKAPPALPEKTGFLDWVRSLFA